MKTINLGNYESAKIQAGIVQEISKTDERTEQQIFDALFAECEVFVEDKCQDEREK